MYCNQSFKCVVVICFLFLLTQFNFICAHVMSLSLSNSSLHLRCSCAHVTSHLTENINVLVYISDDLTTSTL